MSEEKLSTGNNQPENTSPNEVTPAALAKDASKSAPSEDFFGISSAPQPTATNTDEAGTGNSRFLFLAVGFVAVLVVAVIAMLVITGGDIAETPAPTTLSAEATAGKQLFLANNCASCHPAEGRAGGTGPRLSSYGINDQGIKNVIRRGKGAMPANSRITDAEIDKIIVYIGEIRAAADKGGK